MTDAYEKILCEAMRASITNHEKCLETNGSKGFGYKFKYLIWFVLLLIVSPQKEVVGDRAIFVMSPLSEKRLKDFCKTEDVYSFGKLNSKLNDMKVKRSTISPFKKAERVKLFFRGVGYYLRHRAELSGYLHYVMEYYSIGEFLIKFSPKEVVTPGMYERYSTLISYLAHGFGIKIIGVQDGAAVDIGVPYKLYCDKMYAFDEFEADTIKKFMLNENCEFILTGFISYLKWDKYPKTKKLIAIASQDWFTDKTKELVRAIANNIDFNKYEIIIYPHYRETLSQYNDIVHEFPQIKIITGVRHSNIDLLITFYSTIVYDFWSVNKDLPVICLHIDGYEANYYRRKNVYVTESIEEISRILSE